MACPPVCFRRDAAFAVRLHLAYDDRVDQRQVGPTVDVAAIVAARHGHPEMTIVAPPDPMWTARSPSPVMVGA